MQDNFIKNLFEVNQTKRMKLILFIGHVNRSPSFFQIDNKNFIDFTNNSVLFLSMKAKLLCVIFYLLLLYDIEVNIFSSTNW